MTWDAPTTVVVPDVTVLQQLGDGKSSWVEIAFYLNQTLLLDADDGTSRNGVGAIPNPWQLFWQGLNIDWGDGHTETVGNVELHQASTGTFLGGSGFFGMADGAFFPCHQYAAEGTYTISVSASIFLTDSAGHDYTLSGSSDLSTFTTGSASVPANTRSRERLVLACANLNDGYDDGTFYDAQFLASATFSDLRSSGPCSQDLGFHGVTAREPWAHSPGYYYAYSFLGIGSAGHDMWLETERFKVDSECSPSELAVWPTTYDDVYAKITDGGPSVGAHQAQDTTLEEDPAGTLGGVGLLFRHTYDHTTGDGNPGNYGLRSLSTGAPIGSAVAPRPDWRAAMSTYGHPALGSYHWEILAGLNDHEMLIRQDGSQYYGSENFQSRHYIADTVTGEVWLAYDLDKVTLTLPGGAASGVHYAGPDFGISQSADGAICFNVSLSSTFIYQAAFLVMDRAGRVKGRALIRATPVAGTVTSDFHSLVVAYTGLIDPEDSRYLYATIWGLDLMSYPRKSGVYRIDVTTGTYTRVAWLRHPYGDAVDADGNEWNAWDYIDHLVYGDPLDGSWLPPGPQIRTAVPLRQVGRANSSRQYPRAHIDGSRQVGAIP